VRLIELVLEAALVTEEERSPQLAKDDSNLLAERFRIREEIREPRFALAVVTNAKGEKRKRLVGEPDILLGLALAPRLEIRLKLGFFFGVGGAELVDRPREGFTEIPIKESIENSRTADLRDCSAWGGAMDGITLTKLGDRN
jgi:hypothetical protein